MKAYEIIGWTFDGAMYCEDHKPEGVTSHGDTPQPIFAGDEIDPLDSCDTCLHEWISANPGKSANDEKAPVFIDQERAEEYLTVPRCRESGYTACACRDCMEIAIGTKDEPLPLCHECEEAGCDATGESDCDREPEEEEEALYATFNRFALAMPREAMQDCSHSGDCESDVKHWAPILKTLNPEIKAADVRAELEEYGAWDEKELSDDEKNWERIVWCAACNLKEENQ